MKVGIYNTVRGGSARFAPFVKEGDPIELVEFDVPPTLENLDLLKETGCEAMIYTAGHREKEAFFHKIADCGVKYICCCCAGFDHLDLAAMKRYGLKGANVPYYSPNAISEHTVLLVLAALRNFRTQIMHVEECNYQYAGLRGREIRNMTIGIVGAGRIGAVTIQCLGGFGPRQIYAYDPYPNANLQDKVVFTSLEELYARCDVVIYHAIYNEANHHMVNKETIKMMKDGVILVNASRGGLFDAEAVLEGIESGKIGGACLDVIEGEDALKNQAAFDKCPIQILDKLLRHPNVIYTPHTAFYTDEADRNLAEGTIENLLSYEATGACALELVR